MKCLHKTKKSPEFSSVKKSSHPHQHVSEKSLPTSARQYTLQAVILNTVTGDLVTVERVKPLTLAVCVSSDACDT